MTVIIKTKFLVSNRLIAAFPDGNSQFVLVSCTSTA